MYDRVFAAAHGSGVAFGTHCAYKDAGMYEVCGRVGYDYVWIDGEHGSLSLNEFQDAIIASNAGGAAAIVRVPGHEERDVKAILDMGPQGHHIPAGQRCGNGRKGDKALHLPAFWHQGLCALEGYGLLPDACRCLPCILEGQPAQDDPMRALFCCG